MDSDQRRQRPVSAHIPDELPPGELRAHDLPEDEVVPLEGGRAAEVVERNKREEDDNGDQHVARRDRVFVVVAEAGEAAVAAVEDERENVRKRGRGVLVRDDWDELGDDVRNHEPSAYKKH